MGILRSKGNLQTFTPGSVTMLLHPQVNKIKEKLQSGSFVLIDTENRKLKLSLSCVTNIKEVMWEVSFAFCNSASHLLPAPTLLSLLSRYSLLWGDGDWCWQKCWIFVAVRIFGVINYLKTLGSLLSVHCAEELKEVSDFTSPFVIGLRKSEVKFRRYGNLRN